MSFWNTSLAAWNESSLESNFSNTKLQMVDIIYNTFPGALVDLPNVEKKEQVYTQWFDIVATEVREIMMREGNKQPPLCSLPL